MHRGGVALLVEARAAVALVQRLNIESRLAQRVLWRVAEGRVRDGDDVHALAHAVEWTDWISPRQSMRVDVTARSSPLQSLRFAALRVKDGVCDRMRTRGGERPDVDVRRPDLPLLLHLDGDFATLYVDTSGEPLFRRGWRSEAGIAPLKETLAAALLAAAGWRGTAGDGPLLDPCCGAGTIAIEAAQLACGIAPGARRPFAFERQRPFAAAAPALEEMRRSAAARVRVPAVRILASDISPQAVALAAQNAVRAGVRDAIGFSVADALDRPAPGPTGTIVVNPPYGERLASDDSFFPALAAHWKRGYSGWTAWVLSPDARLPTAMRLRETRRIPLWNGPIECRLFRFAMVAGSNRERRDPGASADAPGPVAPTADGRPGAPAR